MDGSGDGMSSGAVTIDQIDPGKHIVCLKCDICNMADYIIQRRTVYVVYRYKLLVHYTMIWPVHRICVVVRSPKLCIRLSHTHAHTYI